MSTPVNPDIAPQGYSLWVIDIGRVVRPFPFVNFGNYFLVLVGIYVLLGVLGFATTTSLGIYEAAALALASSALAFCAWVGWRNIGVLGAVMHGYTTAAFLTFAAFCSLLTLFYVLQLQKFPSIDSEEGKEAFIFAFYYGFLALVAFFAVGAITILRRLRIKELNISLRDFLKRVLIEDEQEREYRLPPSNPKLGAFYLGLGFLWLLGIYLIPNRWFLSSSNTVRIVNQVSQVGFVFLIYARQYFQPDFKTLRAADKRPPVLLLRSFKDDEKISYQSADGSLLDFSLESRLAGHFSALGPFIAVGEPKDKLPHLGAVRVQLSDDEWQGSVTGWMDESRLIVLMAGQTKWVGWELQEIVKRGHATKFVLLFPQIKVRFWKKGGRKANAAERMQVLCTSFRGTIWEGGLALLQQNYKPERIRSIAFHPTGGVITAISKPKNRESYHLAALMAHNFVESWRGRRTGETQSKSDAGEETLKSLASIGARTFAAVLDGMVIAGAYFAATYKLPESVPHVVRVGVGLLLAFGYYFGFEALLGATPGKIVAGIEVRGENGESCGAGSALTRNAMRVVDFIGGYLVGFLVAQGSRLRQRLGDRLAGTVVVRRGRPAAVRLAVAAICVTILGFGAMRAIETAPSLSELIMAPSALPKGTPVSSTGRLRAGNFQFVESRNGPERSSTFQAGENVSVSYYVFGAMRGPNAVANVKITLTIFDPSGIQIRESETVLYNESMERTAAIHAWFAVPLPLYSPAGEYRLVAKAHDAVANTDLEFRPTFKVEAPSVAPANGLEIRDLGLSLAEDGAPRQDTVLPGAGKIYVTCSLFGLQFAGNHRKARLALTLLAPDGETILNQPDFLVIDDEVFYRPASYHELIKGSISMTAEAKPGAYTQKYTLTDEIAGKSTEASVTFRVASR